MFMKVIKTKKYIIFSIAIILLIVCVGICCYKKREKVKKEEAIAEQQAIENAGIEASIKEKAISNAQKYCYTIEFTDEKEFCIEKDNVKYFYIINASEVSLYSCEFYVEENVSVKEGTIEITLTNFGDGKVHAFYHDTRVIVLDDGTEKDKSSTGHFISSKEFDKDSLVIDNFLPDAEQNARDAYDTIMKFTTVDILKAHYNDALAICEQLNN